VIHHHHRTLAGLGSEHQAILWIVVGMVFVVALIALILVYRRLRRAAELEHAERVIAEAFGDDQGTSQ
jgi:hypothetical protein